MSEFIRFVVDEGGAVTVDWIALTMGILLAGLIVIYAIFGDGVNSLVSAVNEFADVNQNATLATVTVEGGGSTTLE